MQEGKMNSKLLNQEYEFCEAENYYIRRNFEGIDYSEGDAAETRIADIVSQAVDISMFSPDLGSACIDWSTYYHLSPKRANILRPLANYIKGQVLEVGAGCGAITRFLGESGVEVLALEGSKRRAAIASSRTRDLANVTVVVEDINYFECSVKFDVITLIGVLEYANVFTKSERPEIDFLKKLRSLLKPDGVLIIAIENQLGLKYFAGSPEDHSGIQMQGIENNYVVNEPRTFGRVQLEKILNQAGFSFWDHYVPIPDYKHPSSIVTQLGLENPGFNAATLYCQGVAGDWQRPDNSYFSLEKTWPVILENKLGLDLSNSFLVVAAMHSFKEEEENALGYHYSVTRRAFFSKETIFYEDENHDVKVRVEGLYPFEDKNSKLETGKYRFEISASEYINAPALAAEFAQIILTPQWHLEQVAAFIGKFIRILAKIIGDAALEDSKDKPYLLISGKYLDAVPQNILMEPDGTGKLIDKEWQSNQKLELGYLIYRSLRVLLQNVTCVAPSAGMEKMAISAFIMESMKKANLAITLEDLARYQKEEAEFQSYVTGRTPSEFLVSLQNDNIQCLPGMAGEVTKNKIMLYYKTDEENFMEDCRLEQEEVLDIKETVFSFALPSSLEGLTQIRLDPLDGCGFVRLFDFTLWDEQRNCIWKWDFAEDSLVAFNGLYPVIKNDNYCILWAPDGDPQLIVAVDKFREALQGKTLYVEVHCAACSDLDIIAILNERYQKLQILGDEVNYLKQYLDMILNSKKWKFVERLSKIKKWFCR